MLSVKMRSIHFLLVFATVSAIAFDDFSPSTNLEYSCPSSRKMCILQSVVIESESDLDGITIPKSINQLIIESGKIPNFTRKLAERLDGINDLTINRVQLVTLYVKPEMTYLDATYNQIEKLLVHDDPAKTYDILTLNLTDNKLSEVGVLSRFAKLRQLTLDRNLIKNLSMDVFRGMSDLRELSLNNNQLQTVDTVKRLQLLKLQSLSLAGNQLVELSVEKWELDSLIELDLSTNKLYILDGSLEQFEKLVAVKISENFWKCDILVKINRFEQLKFDRDELNRCKDNKMANVNQVCCYDETFDNPADDDLGQFEEKWAQLHQLNESFQQFKNTTEQNQQRIQELQKNNETMLMERIKQLEDGQSKMWDQLNERHESEMIEEVNELKSVISGHESKIGDLESAQRNLTTEMKNMNETVDKVWETVKLQNNTKTDEIGVIERKVIELRTSLKNFERQQLKYNLLSFELKGQIGTLREQMDTAQKNIQIIRNNLTKVGNEED